MKQMELRQTVGVLAPTSFVPAGTLITEEILDWRPIEKGAFREGMATKLEDVIAMENIVPLGRDEPILLWKLDKFHLLPSSGQATFQLPKEYVLSIASGIRAGDEVDLYVSEPGGGSAKLFPHGVRVASVKSASGIEVDAPAESNLAAGAKGDKESMYASRREDSGVIDRINLNLTEEEWLKIDRLCKEGAIKLVIAFTPSTIKGAIHEDSAHQP